MVEDLEAAPSGSIVLLHGELIDGLGLGGRVGDQLGVLEGSAIK